MPITPRLGTQAEWNLMVANSDAPESFPETVPDGWVPPWRDEMSALSGIRPPLRVVPPVEDVEEGLCPRRADETHCEHWWDGDAPCCDCGDDSQGDSDKCPSTAPAPP